jgi:hypothetical protein
MVDGLHSLHLPFVIESTENQLICRSKLCFSGILIAEGKTEFRKLLLFFVGISKWQPRKLEGNMELLRSVAFSDARNCHVAVVCPSSPHLFLLLSHLTYCFQSYWKLSCCYCVSVQSLCLLLPHLTFFSLLLNTDGTCMAEANVHYIATNYYTASHYATV